MNFDLDKFVETLKAQHAASQYLASTAMTPEAMICITTEIILLHDLIEAIEVARS